MFATTHWSVVLAAGQRDSPQAADAMEKLCRAYWFPLYAYVRRCGYDVPDAQDLTQSFFVRLLERNLLAGLKPAGGSSARSWPYPTKGLSIADSCVGNSCPPTAQRRHEEIPPTSSKRCGSAVLRLDRIVDGARLIPAI